MQADISSTRTAAGQSTNAPLLRNFIGGTWRDSATGTSVPNVNPANIGEVICHTPLSSREEASAAVESAKNAFPKWRSTPAPVRGQILFKAMALMQHRLEDLATALTKEEGKIIRESRGEVQRSVNIMEFTAGEGRRLNGTTIPSEFPNTFIYTIREPRGVVGIITPWNFPVAIPVWKLAPALLSGNTVVFKPATLTPLTATKIVQIFEEAGLPAGVLNMVFGTGSVVGHEIINHPDVRAVSFTGSTDVGLALYHQASKHGAEVQCEMGGKNPLIVLRDADLDLAVEGAIIGGFGTTGQRCTASSRVILEEPIAKEFLNRFAKRMESFKSGNGLDPSVDMGPSVDEAQMNTVLQYIEIGQKEGARMLAGGKRNTSAALAHGYFVEPTLFDGVASQMRIAQEEIFGPVVAILRARDFSEAVAIANDVKYGLSASLYSNDMARIMKFVELAEVGKVHVNSPPIGGEAQAPFGGIKATGIGPREQGKEVFDFYTDIKTVYIDYPQQREHSGPR